MRDVALVSWEALFVAFILISITIVFGEDVSLRAFAFSWSVRGVFARSGHWAVLSGRERRRD